MSFDSFQHQTMLPRTAVLSTAAVLRGLLGLLVVIFISAIPATSQNGTGRIIGMVTDSQGASLVGAKVRITNTGTNVGSSAVTDSSGAYQVLNLPIGTYSVSVELQGFAKIVTDPRELTINQSLRIDFRMNVGAVKQVVEVRSESAQIETVNPRVGGTVTGKPILNLPLNGREVLDLAFTQSGVLPAPLISH
jgi:hypothetical protein